MFSKFCNLFNKLIQKIKKDFNLYEFIVLLIYIIVIIVISLHHEFSLDENQSFLITRDLNFFDMIAQLKHEGHSFIWYAMLFPIAHLGFSIETQKIIPILFSVLTAFIILKKAPFNKIVKLLLLFSPGMIYYYSCFSRPYCLIVFLLSCIACIYKNKHEHPYAYSFLIGILANTHLVMVPVSFILEIIFLYDEKQLSKNKNEKNIINNKKIWISIIIFCLLFLIEAIFVLFGYYYCSIVTHYDSDLILLNIVELLSKTWIKTLKIYYGVGNTSVFYSIITGFVILLATIGSFFNLKKGIIFIVQFTFMYIIHSFFWFVIPTRAYLSIYIIMFCLWISKESDSKDKGNIRISNFLLYISLILFIIITVPHNYKCIKEDYNKLFSTGKVTAKYIEENIPKNSVFLYLYLDYQQSVAGNLDSNDYKFYLALSDRYATFSSWDIDYDYTVNKKYILKLSKKIKELEKNYKNVYILVVDDIDSDVYTVAKLEKYYDIDLIYDSKKENTMDDGLAWDIKYFKIYRVNKS